MFYLGPANSLGGKDELKQTVGSEYRVFGHFCQVQGIYRSLGPKRAIPQTPQYYSKYEIRATELWHYPFNLIKE